jgi:hypothetical protein
MYGWWGEVKVDPSIGGRVLLGLLHPMTKVMGFLEPRIVRERQASARGKLEKICSVSGSYKFFHYLKWRMFGVV